VKRHNLQPHPTTELEFTVQRKNDSVFDGDIYLVTPPNHNQQIVSKRRQRITCQHETNLDSRKSRVDLSRDGDESTIVWTFSTSTQPQSTLPRLGKGTAADNMSLTNCRFYEEKYPEIDSFVMVNVKQVGTCRVQGCVWLAKGRQLTGMGTDCRYGCLR
jgi:hypothetical protein